MFKKLVTAAIAVSGLIAPAAQAHTVSVGSNARVAAACPVMYTVQDYRVYAGKVYSRSSVSKAAQARMRAMHICQRNYSARKAVGSVHDALISARKARQAASRDPWRARFEALSAADQTWARRIGQCESGNNPRINTGNGFEGAMQWVRSTWYAAGGSGSPVNASLHEQYVRAVKWRNRTSTMQWPGCSKKLGYA